MKHRLAIVLLAAALFSGMARADAISDALAAYDIAKAPANKRGQTVPIADNAAYGYTYVDEDGWYTFVLPSTATAKRDDYKGTVAQLFTFQTGASHTFCLIAKAPADRVGTIAQFQANVRSLLTPAAEAYYGLPSNEFTDRRVIKLGDGGYPVRKAIEIPVWGRFSTDYRGERTAEIMSLVQFPAGALFVNCTAATDDKARLVLSTALRIAEGALQPAH